MLLSIRMLETRPHLLPLLKREIPVSHLQTQTIVQGSVGLSRLPLACMGAQLVLWRQGSFLHHYLGSLM